MTVQLTHSWDGNQGDPWDNTVWNVILTGNPTVRIDTANGDPTGRGEIVIASSAQRAICHLQGASELNLDDMEVQLTIRTTDSSGGGHMIFLRGSGVWAEDDVEDGYRLIFDNDDNEILPRRYIGGSSTDLTPVSGYNPGADTDYSLKVRIYEDAGQTVIEYKLWEASQQEPGSWTTIVTDSNGSRPLSGNLGVGMIRAAGTLPMSIFFDDLIVDDMEVGETPHTHDEIDLAGGTDPHQRVTLSARTVDEAVIATDQFEALISVAVHPDGDTVLGAWTRDTGSSTDLFEAINEPVLNDSDYIQSGDSPINFDICEVSLGDVTDPQSSVNHFVTYRYGKNAPGGDSIDLIVRLMQGANQIAAWQHTNISSTLTTVRQELTPSQADAITDYTDLRLRFEAAVTP